MLEQSEERLANPADQRPAAAALWSVVFIAIAMLLIFGLLPAALVAAAT